MPRMQHLIENQNNIIELFKEKPGTAFMLSIILGAIGYGVNSTGLSQSWKDASQIFFWICGGLAALLSAFGVFKKEVLPWIIEMKNGKSRNK